MNGIDFTAIFKAQVAGQIERITGLTEDLSQCNKNSDDNKVLMQDLMREFHTIKGAARAIQYEDIKEVAHALENIYHAIIDDGVAIVLPALCELNQHAINTVQALLNARLSGEAFSPEVDIAELANAYIQGDVVNEVVEPTPEPESAPTPKPASAVAGIDFTAIFKAQVDGQIQRITACALALEQCEPDLAANETLLQDLMREFHTIKGAARAIQYEDIKDVGHAIEEIYHAILAKQANVRLPLLTDLSLHAVDLIKGMLEARIQGVSFVSESDLAQMAEAYIAGEDVELPSSQPAAMVADAVDSTDQDVAPVSTQLDASEYEQLTDSLLNLSGELAIGVSSISSHHGGMQRLSRNFSELQREMNHVLNTLAEPLQKAGLEGGLERLNRFNKKLRSVGKQQNRMLNFLDHADSRLHILNDDLSHTVSDARLVPLSILFDDYPRQIRDLSKQLNKDCQLQLTGTNARIDRAVIDVIKAPLMHTIRNAIDHGLETADERLAKGKPAQGTLKIEVLSLGGYVKIIIADDGRGMDIENIHKKVIERGDTTEQVWQSLTEEEQMQFLFLPGFSTAKTVTETSGRGFGMDIVKTTIESVGGHVDLHFEKGQGTTLTMQLPLSLSLTRCLLVNAGQHDYFGDQFMLFPLADVKDVRHVEKADIKQVEAQDTLLINDQPVSVFSLAALMGLSVKQQDWKSKTLILLESKSQGAGKTQLQCIGLLVEKVLDERDVITRAIDSRLGKIRDVQSISLMVDGSVTLVADTNDLINTATSSSGQSLSTSSTSSAIPASSAQKQVLIVEDSMTVREVERHMLEEQGYKVTTAVDGVDGVNQLRGNHYDLIISDIDMPRMNGIEMIKKVRAHDRHKGVPIIVVSYKDREKDQLLAMDAGANVYITKAAFDSGEIMQTIKEMIG